MIRFTKELCLQMKTNLRISLKFYLVYSKIFIKYLDVQDKRIFNFLQFQCVHSLQTMSIISKKRNFIMNNQKCEKVCWYIFIIFFLRKAFFHLGLVHNRKKRKFWHCGFQLSMMIIVIMWISLKLTFPLNFIYSFIAYPGSSNPVETCT